MATLSNAEIFRKAADYIREHGLLKGEFGHDGGPRCLEGALESACGLPALPPSMIITANIPSGVYTPVALRFNWPESGVAPYQWSDALERTAEEVAAMFEDLAFDEDLKAAATAVVSQTPNLTELDRNRTRLTSPTLLKEAVHA